jgi:hypothetical protein
MTLKTEWRELHRTRFPELPDNCGNRNDPGVIDGEDLRNWSTKATTPDQARIEEYIDRFDLRAKRILHVGIGNSGLARRFHNRVGEIVGTTIDQPEIDVADALSLPNYRAVLHNKFDGSGSATAILGPFDFIIDNNPTSPCCCMKHLAVLFDFYAEKLSNHGQIVTDLEGLQWVPDESNPRWSFDFADLAAVAEVAGFSAFKATRKVYVLSRSPPAKPGYAAVLRHLLRRVKSFPVKLVRTHPRMIAAVARRLLKRALVATVPRFFSPNYRRND